RTTARRGAGGSEQPRARSCDRAGRATQIKNAEGNRSGEARAGEDVASLILSSGYDLRCAIELNHADNSESEPVA
ncbi:hypothetical protein, partial [Limnothrix sp. PR1529]|uniref:hypothetical protein n=1 Tax=Limnothrix sp. PR1529 TaxID=1704291 RepID=UPI001F1B922C